MIVSKNSYVFKKFIITSKEATIQDIIPDEKLLNTLSKTKNEIYQTICTKAKLQNMTHISLDKIEQYLNHHANDEITKMLE
ncbi:MAG: hypothetical protein P857_339 [Candidatus Xenolissoclinum pacificiensis L6]|uniref:Uncharacterized protein n=1 Tax=Candidatus Xenolissoclinum pacificiensis L6 TaxID=1401685 RepID=W2UZM4_9RICK|nr:MAG: hypothetical protein P857_339 [Candidatus Xenolissoclinum pacificiensis L6]